MKGICGKWKERQRREDECTNTWGLLYTVGKITVSNITLELIQQV